MREVNEQSFSHRRQRSVRGVEKRVRTHIVLKSDPFSFQYSPKCFRNVQVRGIRRRIEKEKTSFLLFKFLQLLEFVPAELRREDSPGRFPIRLYLVPAPLKNA